jgi:GPH family glycoside/pentoside/hexuronide:cation symporter
MVGPMLGWVATNQYLLYFYTEILRLPPGVAGLIFGIGMVWDALTDPVIGWLSDRTHSRWGRYRAWLLWAAIPYGLSLPLAFAGWDASLGALAITAAMATNLLFRTLYSAVYMPYTAMLAAIASGYDERTSYTSWKTVFIFGSNLAVSFGFLTIALAFGGETVAGFASAAAIFGLIGAICILASFAATAGLERTRPAKGETLGRGLADLGRDKAFLILFSGVMICGGFGSVMSISTAYVAKYWLGDPTAARWLFTCQAVAALMCIPVWSAIARRTGKRAVWVAGATLSSLGMLGAWAVSPSSAMGLLPFYAIAQVGYTGFIIVMFAMTADLADWNEARTARRHEGVAFGSIAFANKLAAGLAASLVGALFGYVGIGAAAKQPVGEAARGSLLDIAFLLPGIGFAIAALLVAFYPISRRAHAEALEAIRMRTA